MPAPTPGPKSTYKETNDEMIALGEAAAQECLARSMRATSKFLKRFVQALKDNG